MSKTAKNIILALVAILLIAAIAGLGAYFFRGVMKGEQQQNPDEPEFSAPNEVLVSSTQVVLSSEPDERTKDIIATIEPANARQEVDWTVEFYGVYPWSSDKEVSDYVVIKPDSDGSMRATIECLQPFGDKIKVTCTARDDNTKKAYCTLEYFRKSSISLNENIPTSFVGYSEYSDAYFVGELDNVGTVDCNTVWVTTNFFDFIEDVFDLPESSISSRFEGRYINKHIYPFQIGEYKLDYLEPYYFARARSVDNVLYISETGQSGVDCNAEAWWLCWKFWYDEFVKGTPTKKDINKYIENYNKLSSNPVYVDFAFESDFLGSDSRVTKRFLLRFINCGNVTPFDGVTLDK